MSLLLTHPSPAAVSGYTLNYLKDSVGGDIRLDKSFKNVSDLGRICDAEPGCIAFTSGGWLKSTLKPQSVRAWFGGDCYSACTGPACLFAQHPQWFVTCQLPFRRRPTELAAHALACP